MGENVLEKRCKLSCQEFGKEISRSRQTIGFSCVGDGDIICYNDGYIRADLPKVCPVCGGAVMYLITYEDHMKY